MNHYELIPSELQDRAARVYLESDHDARLAGEWREDTDGGMRVAAYVVLCAMFAVAGVVLVAVVRLLGQGG